MLLLMQSQFKVTGVLLTNKLAIADQNRKLCNHVKLLSDE